MGKPARIYTRSGDRGTTGLVGGERVKKSALRIEAYGTVDELSSAVGVARAALQPARRELVRAARLDAWLAWAQDALFNLGSELATPGTVRIDQPHIEATDAQALERAIDDAQAELPPLTNFIAPGGSLPGAQLHFARTICRRAERLVVALHDQEPGAVSSETLAFVNRLSDALFVWARWINDAMGEAEHRWNPASRPPDASETG